MKRWRKKRKGEIGALREGGKEGAVHLRIKKALPTDGGSRAVLGGIGKGGGEA